MAVFAAFQFTGTKWYFLDTLSVIINHHPKGYPNSHRVLTEGDRTPAGADKNIWKNRV